MKNKNIFVGFVCLIFWASIGLTDAVHAESLGLGIQIPKAEDGSRRDIFEMVLTPGESSRDAIRVNNNSDKGYYVLTEGLDVLEGGRGSYLFVNNAILNEDVGDWIDIDQRVWSLPANSSILAGFTVTVPEDALPGMHSGGVAVSKYDPSNKNDVKVISRVGAIVNIVVPGEVVRELDFELQGHKFYDEKGSAEFTYQLTNMGSVPVQPQLEISISNFFWQVRKELAPPLDILKPGESKVFTLGLDNPGDYFGLYKVNFDFNLPEAKTADSDGKLEILPELQQNFVYHFTVFNWGYYILLNLLIFVLWLLFMLAKYFYLIKLWRKRYIIHLSKKSEGINAVVKRYGVTAEVLISLNNLKKTGRGELKKRLKIPLGEWAPTEWSEIKDRHKIPSFWSFAFLNTKFSQPKRIIKI